MLVADLPLVSGDLFSDLPLKLSSGETLRDIQVGYTIIGEPNFDSEVILICHALTGDQYVSEKNPLTNRDGWWSEYVGSGKCIDTDKYCVITTNVLGGCMGTTGPTSTHDVNGDEFPWGSDFPVVTIEDMVKVQREFLRSIGVNRLYAIIGGSMGGMQVLEWLRLFPEYSNKFLVIASSYRQSVQNIGFHQIGRRAIELDPNWCSGHYLKNNSFPDRGLTIARMVALMTYQSQALLAEKFDRRLQSENQKLFKLTGDFQIESYLDHHGSTFTNRFDPCSYVFITKAVDYFDQSEICQGDLNEAYSINDGIKGKFVDLISFDSDTLYPTSEMSTIYEAVLRNGGRSNLQEISTIHGHDSFLIHNSDLMNAISETIF